MMADSRQVELVAVRAQIDELKNRVGDAEKEFAATQTRLEQERGESDKATRELAEARGRVENLSQRVTDLDRQLIVQVKEAEMLGNRVNDLEARLATQGKLLAERDYENNQLRQANDTAERTVKELRDELAAVDGGKSPALEKLRTEKAAAEEQLRIARDERAKAAARHQRDPAAGRKLVGDRADGKRAVARTHQRHRRRSRKARDAARGAEFADRGHAGRRTRRSRPSRAKPANGAAARPVPRPRAAARSPNASARCSPTPPAPASSSRAETLRLVSWPDWLDIDGPRFVNRGLSDGMRSIRRRFPGLLIVHEIPGRIAQRESVPFTRERSKVRSLVRPPLDFNFRQSDFRKSMAMTPQKLVVLATSLAGGAIGLFAPVGVVKWVFLIEPEDAGILTLFFFPVWCLIVVTGLLAGRRLGLFFTGGKRAVQR